VTYIIQPGGINGLFDPITETDQFVYNTQPHIVRYLKLDKIGQEKGIDKRNCKSADVMHLQQ